MGCEEVLSGRAETGRRGTIEGRFGEGSPARADFRTSTRSSGSGDDIHPYRCEVCIAANCERHPRYTGARREERLGYTV